MCKVAHSSLGTGAVDNHDPLSTPVSRFVLLADSILRSSLMLCLQATQVAKIMRMVSTRTWTVCYELVLG